MSGFLEAGNFYPDFILWCLNADGSQRIVFIDPHGLEHEGLGSDKNCTGPRDQKAGAALEGPDGDPGIGHLVARQQ